MDEVTFLFTDIEGSTRLWEQAPERMRPALARHDAIAREAVDAHAGVIVKSTGDGIHAAFDDPLNAIRAAIHLQRALADPQSTEGLALHVRCGLHCGRDERRDGDFFGTAVNRAARIMGAAHGGQVLLSEAVALRASDALPDGIGLNDLGSVRLRDLARPERVFQVLHPELRAEFPPLRSLERTPNNLPLALTSFVGRERELSAIGELLARNRLVTVLGMGGLGKSRLALEAAANAIDDFPDGVFVVELASRTEPERLAEAVAAVLGVKEQPGLPIMDTVAAHARDRRMLLLLDNCEHVIAACALAARDLLEACAGVRILASSREPLQLGGEATFPLAPLAVPSALAAFEPAVLMQYDSVRLFVERAVMAAPAFRLDAHNAAAVAAICHRLDGIPLAIELAAARLRSLPVQALADRLKDRFRLLATNDPTVSPRQRTLRALIDWSHDLLSERERTLLRQLAVFSGGWTLEASEAVCRLGDDTEPVLEVLSRLVEKSLVVMEPEGERYRLLETVRQFAAERLDEAGDGEAVRRRHFDYYASLADEAKPGLVGENQAAWLARLDAERENILAAHRWSLGGGVEASRALDMLIGVKLYWFNRGLVQLGQRITAEALAREPAQTRSMARCKGLFAVGQFCSLLGRYAEARAALEESLAIARERRDEHSTAVVLQALGMAVQGMGDTAAARACLEEGYVLAKRRGDSRALASAANELAQLHRVEGKFDAARPLYEEMLAIARGMRDGETVAVGLLNLAMLEIADGKPGPVAALLLEAIDVCAALKSRRMTQSILEVCAGLAAARGEWARAAEFFGAAETQAGNTGLQREPADEAFLAPLIAVAKDTLGAERFSQQESAGRALPHAEAVRRAQGWLEAARTGLAAITG